ncbi:MAG: LuxR C-terminal-related transcriptional regulator [Spirochaetia bacterium]|jgi:DNA-binding CsgD family transcriptional regulator
MKPVSAGQKVMIHALALAYFLTIIAGFVVVTLSLLLYARFASPAYLHWALIMLGGTLLITAKAVTHYLRLAGSGTSWYLLLSFMLLGLSGELLLGYCVPLIAHGVAGIRISPGRGALHGLVVAVLGAQVVIEGLTEDDMVAAIRVVSRIVWIGYGYAILISGTRSVTEQNQRAVIRAFLATGSIVLPIMLFSVLATLFLPDSLALHEAPVASLLWLSAYSTLSIVLIARFIFGPQNKVNWDVPDLFARIFSISDREREIIRLILQGNTEARIGDLLFISRRTVVNHVYNIYRKTGVRNRVQLINLLNTNVLSNSRQWPFLAHRN